MSDEQPGTPPPDPGSSWRDYSKYTAVAFQMAVIIGVFAYAGYKIDAHYRHVTPWVTAILCVVGVALSIYQVIRQLRS